MPLKVQGPYLECIHEEVKKLGWNVILSDEDMNQWEAHGWKDGGRTRSTPTASTCSRSSSSALAGRSRLELGEQGIGTSEEQGRLRRAG